MGGDAGNAWAPEAHFDTKLGRYLVYWASTLYPGGDHDACRYQGMMYALTDDFQTFSPLQIYLDRGHSVIDATLIEHDGHSTAS